MKQTVLIIGLVCFGFGTTLAQPMSGSYTVGGIAPDFATPQDAASALFQRGVSGPVFINIRPGLYMRNGGNSTVLRLDTLIAGHSSTNRITFQSDASSGGNVDNVILRFNRTDPLTADRDLVLVQLDFVTLRNLTLDDIDSSHTSDNHLIRLAPLDSRNPVIDGFVLEGCKLIGTPHQATAGLPLGTDVGIGSQGTVSDLIVRGNIFVRLMRAISFLNVLSQTVFIVEDNRFLEGYSSASGSGNRIGAGIEISCTQAIVRRNIIDFTNTFNGGFRGIYVERARTAFIERNAVWGRSEIGVEIYDFTNTADSILIANNMITGGNYRLFTGAPSTPSAMSSQSRNARIIYNTIVVPDGTVNPTCLIVTGADCTVLNNIIINNSGVGVTTALYLGNSQTQNLHSDYNVIYKNPNASGPLVVRDGVSYAGLRAYQDSTGLDRNSISKDIDFLNILSDLHLSDCQAQDPDLVGLPIPGITEDIDGDVRSATRPLKGADEVAQRAIPLWGDVFKIAMPGTPFSVAAGNIDGQPGEDLAIPDYDNREVRIYRNNGAGRSFTHLGNVPTGFRPVVVRFTDFDGDGHLDLVVSADDTNMVTIFWGNGTGGFPMSLTVGTFGRVRSFIPEPTRINPNFRTIILTESIGGLVPQTSLLGFLVNYDQRDPLAIEQLVLRREEPGFPADTLPAVLYDLRATDLNGAGTYEVATIGLFGTIGIFGLFDSLRAVPTGFPIPFAHRFHARFTRHAFNTTSYVGHAANIGTGDFDGDSDIDLIATGSSELRCVLIRNQGGLAFSAETVAVNNAHALAVLDYNNDGRLDFVSVNRLLDDNGLTLYLNDGTGRFRSELNCYPGFASGYPFGIVASDFDLDGRTDLAVASASDSVFVLYNFGGGISNVRDGRTSTPSSFRLEQNYPNPFNPVTNFKFSLPAGQAGIVNSQLTILKVYNILGQEVATLVNEVLPPGEHVRQWDASGFASGVYFYRLHAGAFVQTKKLILLR